MSRTEVTPVGEPELNQPDGLRRVVAAATGRLFGIFDDPQQGRAVVESLSAADLVPGERIWTFHGERGLRRLDPRGTGHGLFGRLVRLVQLVMTRDDQYLDALAEALRAGGLVVALPVVDLDAADRLAAGLRARAGHTFAYTAHRNFVPVLGEI